jgi:hypothetical protein
MKKMYIYIYCGVSDCVYYHCIWNNTPGGPKLRFIILKLILNVVRV